MAGGQSVAVFEAGKLHGFGLAEGLPAGSVSAFAEDRARTIWLAHARGLFRLDTNRSEKVFAVEGGSFLVHKLYGDSHGALWMAPINDSLTRWHEGRLFHKRLPPELPMSELHDFAEDHLGFLWISSHQGVLRAHQNELKAWLEGAQPAVVWQVFDPGDGMPGLDCTGSAKDEQDRLWFATTRGIAALNPAINHPMAAPPAVQIEEVTYHRAAGRVYGGEALGAPAPLVRSRLEGPFPERLVLPPGSRRLQVHYTAFDFSAPEKLRFQIKLEPADSDWQDVGTRRTA